MKLPNPYDGGILGGGYGINGDGEDIGAAEGSTYVGLT
jgi:hypothetical protein